MAADNNKKKTLEPNEPAFALWGRRSPNFERRYEESVIKKIADYGKGTTQLTEARGKILGPGYEAFIMAFFIGLYAGRKLTMTTDTSEKKDFGWPIENWSGVDRGGRHKYEDLRFYMFAALVAKSDVNWLGVDEGVIPISEAVTKLIRTMEEYANYGFSVMEDKLRNDPDYFFGNRPFLDIFLDLSSGKRKTNKKTTGPEAL